MTEIIIDQAIVDRAIRGDKEAFSLIVKKFGVHTLFVAERVLGSPEAAASAVQTLFVTAYADLKKLKNVRFLEVWLLQMLVRLCRERPREARPCGAPAGRRETARSAVDSLPFMERTAVIFRDWDGIGTLEVAEIVGSRQESVRKLLVRARKSVADRLGPFEARSWPAQKGCCDTPETSCVSDIAGTTTLKDRFLRKARGRQDCRKVAERLWLLVGGELGQTEQADLMSHLRHCSACGAYLRYASAILEQVRGAAPLMEGTSVTPEMLWKEIDALLVA